MTTPAASMKHFWRTTRQPGESLKAFARRPPNAGKSRDGVPTTASAWLLRKRRRNKPAASWADLRVTVAGMELGPPMPAKFPRTDRTAGKAGR